jgi:hypothetical protein
MCNYIYSVVIVFITTIYTFLSLFIFFYQAPSCIPDMCLIVAQEGASQVTFVSVRIVQGFEDFFNLRENAMRCP